MIARDAAPGLRSYRIGVIHGDGIGPEIVAASLAVLDAVAAPTGFSAELVERPGGAAYYEQSGRNLPDGALQDLAECDGILKGPVGLPEVRFPDGSEAGLLGGVMREGLDTYANVRPIRSYPGIETALRAAHEIDYVIVRENTEGLYASRGRGVANRWAATDLLFQTRPGIERVARFAFRLARERGRSDSCVTCVDKSNVLRSYVLFRQVVTEVAAEYPDVRLDYVYSDAAAQALVLEPDRFDVIVTENFLGDILSDLGGATVGGVGMLPSGNVGDDHAYFEPVHGSAPSLATLGRANPTSQILALAMLLDHLGEHVAAGLINDAVHDAYAAGDIPINPDGTPTNGTSAVTSAIIARLGEPVRQASLTVDR